MTTKSKYVVFQKPPDQVLRRQLLRVTYWHDGLEKEPPTIPRRGDLQERAIVLFRTALPFALAVELREFPNISVVCDPRHEVELPRVLQGFLREEDSLVSMPPLRADSCWSPYPWKQRHEEIRLDLIKESPTASLREWAEQFAERMQAEAQRCHGRKTVEVVMPKWMAEADIFVVQTALNEIGYRGRFSRGPHHWTLRELIEGGGPPKIYSAEGNPDLREELRDLRFQVPDQLLSWYRPSAREQLIFRRIFGFNVVVPGERSSKKLVVAC